MSRPARPTTTVSSRLLQLGGRRGRVGRRGSPEQALEMAQARALDRLAKTGDASPGALVDLGGRVSERRRSFPGQPSHAAAEGAGRPLRSHRRGMARGPCGCNDRAAHRGSSRRSPPRASSPSKGATRSAPGLSQASWSSSGAASSSRRSISADRSRPSLHAGQFLGENSVNHTDPRA